MDVAVLRVFLWIVSLLFPRCAVRFERPSPIVICLPYISHSVPPLPCSLNTRLYASVHARIVVRTHERNGSWIALSSDNRERLPYRHCDSWHEPRKRSTQPVTHLRHSHLRQRLQYHFHFSVLSITNASYALRASPPYPPFYFCLLLPLLRTAQRHSLALIQHHHPTTQTSSRLTYLSRATHWPAT